MLIPHFKMGWVAQGHRESVVFREGRANMENESIEQRFWLTEVVLPGLFTLILLLCLIYLGMAAMAQSEPALGELSAISAFAS